MPDAADVEITNVGIAHPTRRRNLENTLINKVIPAGSELVRSGLKVFMGEPIDVPYNNAYNPPPDDDVQITYQGPAHPSRRRNLENTLMQQIKPGTELVRAGLKVFIEPGNFRSDTDGRGNRMRHVDKGEADSLLVQSLL